MTGSNAEEDRLTEMSDAWTDNQPAYRSWVQAIEEIRLDNLSVTLEHARQSTRDEVWTVN